MTPSKVLLGSLLLLLAPPPPPQAAGETPRQRLAGQFDRVATALVQTEENKEVVTSLREIAAGYIAADYPQAEEGSS